MPIAWVHAWPTMLAAFLAAFVEAVEALTVVLAVGVTRGWRGALIGTGLASAALALLVLAAGPALTRMPLPMLQLVVGTLLLMFGLRWLRKAILRAGGVIPLHDEAAAYARELATLGGRSGAARAWDGIAVGTAFQIVMLEGLEVVFIVIAIGAGGTGLLWPASVGAMAAAAAVVLLGLVVHKPLAAVPENTLKFVVGVLLSAFGTFWAGEGCGIAWPGSDLAILALVAAFAVVASVAVPMARSARAGAQAPRASVLR